MRLLGERRREHAQCRGEAREASPSGHAATRPRASIGLSVTLARTAALTVARSCAWLSRVQAAPLAK
jgi:hypothetical protein